MPCSLQHLFYDLRNEFENTYENCAWCSTERGYESFADRTDFKIFWINYDKGLKLVRCYSVEATAEKEKSSVKQEIRS